MKLPTIALVFDRKRSAAKSGTGPVEIRVTFQRRQFYLATGVAVRPKEWKDKTGVINRLDMIELNKRIQAIRSVIEYQSMYLR